ncbi:MAG: DUF2807 domain-containing protein [Bacteroidales bacterium]|nr:DUF2807 domain-containing protein [Lentimicrobiaceae bacterium]MDD5696164.1 DUF2807 domain-containing protein [Bacteroidales bacterium]
MKRVDLISVMLCVAVLTAGCAFPTFAQWQKGSGNVIQEARELPAFDKIKVGGILELQLSQGSVQKVMVEVDDNLLSNIKTVVEDQTLTISTEKIHDFSKLLVHVTLPDLTYLNASGASQVSGATPLEVQYLMIDGSGAAEIDLELLVQVLESKLSGAAQMHLTGSADSHKSDLSGAASLEAFDLETQTTIITASGATTGEVSGIKELTIDTSGAGEVKYNKEPETLITNPSKGIVKEPSSKGVVIIRADDWNETTEVKVGGISVDVREDDTVRITLGDRELVISDDGHVELLKEEKERFRGHWGGLHLGINGYVDRDFSTQVPKEYDFLDLKYEKSFNVQLNIYEQNFNLYRNHLGLITGIGFNWSIYNYAKDLHFVADSAEIYAYHGKEGNEYAQPHPERNYIKSKLMIPYLTIPLLLEYQTNHYCKTNSFHLTAGVVGGVRLGTKARVKWDDSGKSKEKHWDSYHMNPFRWDAYAGMGWGIINLYATYSLNPLFQKDEGPEEYPFTLGITLLPW